MPLGMSVAQWRAAEDQPGEGQPQALGGSVAALLGAPWALSASWRHMQGQSVVLSPVHMRMIQKFVKTLMPGPCSLEL